MKKKTHGLTILLMKHDVTSAIQAVKEPGSLKSLDVDVNGTCGTFYYKQNASHSPSWVKLFKPKLGNQLDTLFNSGTAAVFFVPAGNSLFAMTFGYGKSLLKADCYEENFGLRVVLNSVDPEKLRSIDVQSLDAVPLNRRNQASVATGIADFGLDIEQDLIYAATGQPKDCSLGKQLTGKDALKVSVPITLDDFPALLTKLHALFESSTYKSSFAWVDHLSEVRDRSSVALLDCALTNKIQSKDFNRTWLSIPEIIDWADVEGFKYQRPKQGISQEDIDWVSYLSFLGDEAPHSVETFKKQYVHCITANSFNEKELLKSNGFRWSSEMKRWVYKFSNESTERS